MAISHVNPNPFRIHRSRSVPDFLGPTLEKFLGSSKTVEEPKLFPSSTYARLDMLSERTSIDDSGMFGNVMKINPNIIRFSQTSVGGADKISESMMKEGWKGSPIDVVKMPDGLLTTIDNTRVLAARIAKIDAKATVHPYNAELMNEMQLRLAKRFPQEDQRGRFILRKGTEKGKEATTWGEAVNIRIQNQRKDFQAKIEGKPGAWDEPDRK